MPRRARMYIPGLPYHLVQRGNNRQACFFEAGNYSLYLNLWKRTALKYGLAVHAYCLMTNHIHFLVTPEHEASISDSMRVIGSRYAQIINKHYERTGTMWEGRHRSSLVQSGTYLLACYRYIELNPVRAAMVAAPHQYPWSSYGENAWGMHDWMAPHQEYLGLGTTREKRCQAYRELFEADLNPDIVSEIRKAAHYCQPFGDNAFSEQIAGKYGVRPGQMYRGRPKKTVG